ncbi:hypothetical protein PACTADRAFT_50054 [Pachysolen tannophilus NRRL Y-2460]|uniref:S-methyl-5-thioribose-1-phosphate isomerase n=1 Tax=Pachysolen tannophilus NRRL Y-2460 TaxID=669874 RepID=A0A1E4TU97_PACTA|nr:hypothetical protein PACTADRAFT_50054 [Pachysolen tannophilus NRRL Y-2460]
MSTLEAIKFDKENCKLLILDQLLIPYQTKYIQVKNIDDGFNVIKAMQVRGAPAIAIVGSFSIVAELNDVVNNGEAQVFNYDLSNYSSFINNLHKRIDYLIKSRPTAVNLLNACNDIREIISENQNTDPKELLAKLKDYSIKLFEDDLVNNYKIGENGVDYIYQDLKNSSFKGPFSVMTICNTGSLATSGHGTALGIIRSLWAKSKLNPKNNVEDNDEFWLSHVYACETRPYNQGARLTSYELNYEKIPFSLITDNMVSFLAESLTFPKKSQDLPDKSPLRYIIVGADRIVHNGDLANKIGTFQLSLIASNFKDIKFIGAAPKTTIDLNLADGSDIVIEQRPSKELTSIRGGELNQEDTFYSSFEIDFVEH